MSVETSSSSFTLEGISDVDDYVWANEGEGSLPWDGYSHVFDLVRNGNCAFRESHFEQAINNYSRANNIKPNDPIILGNRCSTYIRISQFLKHRPPSASESRPLNGLDPMTHAELALKDAEKLLNLRSNLVKSYILKANALILPDICQAGTSLSKQTKLEYYQTITCLIVGWLFQFLEKYEMARDVILSGLQVDPFSYCMNLSQLLVGIPFADHVCFSRWIAVTNVHCAGQFSLLSPRTCAISVTLKNIIEKNFPEEYAERKAEHDSLSNFGVDLIPLFVMDVVIPCQKFPLHIFEPRYRLMVRRVMEGNHRMGMVIIDPTTGSIADFACEVEITECEPLPDGRFLLEVKYDS
ncbi:hypothetical protein Patl1_18799 [Pistacia atlantica]|uniref:Uncharacterized protein n=1 Tax=Pistacia atlantica TaxID=434234 RepID=A0ACC1C1M1_9ROSI|nr:hypothetical protein Patl1_18799 [Pistacia atlantica]